MKTYSNISQLRNHVYVARSWRQAPRRLLLPTPFPNMLAVLLCASLAAAVDAATCSATSFPTAEPGKMCFGLTQLARNKMGAPIKTETQVRCKTHFRLIFRVICWLILACVFLQCLDACCDEPSCTQFQFSAGGGAGGCWVWDKPGKPPQCTQRAGWAGRSGRQYEPPPPPPPPGAPLAIHLPSAGPIAQPLPFKINASTGTLFSTPSSFYTLSPPLIFCRFLRVFNIQNHGNEQPRAPLARSSAPIPSV